MARQHKANFARQVVLASVGNICSFAALFAMTLVELPFSATVHFYIAIGLLVATSITTSYIQNDIIAIASTFPPHHMQAIMSGQGLAGVLSAVAPLFIALTVPSSIANTPHSVQQRAGVYFISCVALLIVALAAFLLLTRLPVYFYYCTERSQYDELEWDITPRLDSSPKPFTLAGLKSVWYRIRYHAIAIALGFFTTLALYPAITSGVASTAVGGDRLSDRAIFTLVHFLVFNLGDWFGRWMPLVHVRLQLQHPTQILILSVARLVLIPLLLLCNVETPSMGDRLFPNLIRSDYGFMILVGLLAVTNGWLGSVCMMNAPNQVLNDHTLVGMVMSWIMTVGMTAGSFAGFGLRGAVCKCYPFTS